MSFVIYVSKNRIECEGGSGHIRSSAVLDLKASPGVDLNRIFDLEDDNALARAKADLRTLTDHQLLCWAGHQIFADSRATQIVRL
jgi:hypothetical protein